jgi:ferredoxin
LRLLNEELLDMSCRLEFTGSDKPPVELKDGECLSEKLTIHNSPILFGCRIGICGTCAIEVLQSDSPLPPRTQDESDFLENMYPGNENIRLACQIHINTNMKIRKVNSK